MRKSFVGAIGVLLAFANVSSAQVASDWTYFFNEPTEGVYSYNWFIKWWEGGGEDEGLDGYNVEYFGLRREGQLYWEGQLQTSCRNKYADYDNFITAIDDGWVPDISEEVFDAIYTAACG